MGVELGLAVERGRGVRGSDLELTQMGAQRIREALARSGVNRTDAAARLGISRRTLQRKPKEMGLIRRQRNSGDASN